MKTTMLFLVAIVAMMVVGCQENASLDPVSAPAIAPPVSGGGPITQKKGSFEILSDIPDFGPVDGDVLCGMLTVKGTGQYALTASLVQAQYEISVGGKLISNSGFGQWKFRGTYRSQTQLNNGTAYIRPSFPVNGRPDLKLVVVCVIDNGDIGLKSVHLERDRHWAVQGN